MASNSKTGDKLKKFYTNKKEQFLKYFCQIHKNEIKDLKNLLKHI